MNNRIEMARRDRLLTGVAAISRILWLIVPLTGLTCCGRCGFGTYYTKGIRNYLGDGIITDASQSSNGLGTRGYVIVFPKFDLSKTFGATYRFSNLPTLGVSPVEIQLLIEDPSLESRKTSLNARIKYSVSDSQGRVKARVDATLSNLIWSSPIHDRFGQALYQLNDSQFVPQAAENYTMHVEYFGDTQLEGKKGSIYLWCGCGGS